MQPVEHFQHCPKCGAQRHGEASIPFRCDTCGFVYYFNPTVAAAVIITRPDGTVLFITRAKEPAKGKLAFPGGFIDIGETAEEGLRREVSEEVGLEIGPLQFLCSYQQEYPYKDVSYPVLDLLFTSPALGNSEAQPLDAVAAVAWHDPQTIVMDDLAFPSLRAGLTEFLRRFR
ncbi:NUDIX domain-containing protein [bacterium]|nr:NUDIX domain-containing protein [bacterium]